MVGVTVLVGEIPSDAGDGSRAQDGAAAAAVVVVMASGRDGRRRRGGERRRGEFDGIISSSIDIGDGAKREPSEQHGRRRCGEPAEWALRSHSR